MHEDKLGQNRRFVHRTTKANLRLLPWMFLCQTQISRSKHHLTSNTQCVGDVRLITVIPALGALPHLAEMESLCWRPSLPYWMFIGGTGAERHRAGAVERGSHPAYGRFSPVEKNSRQGH